MAARAPGRRRSRPPRGDRRLALARIPAPAREDRAGRARRVPAPRGLRLSVRRRGGNRRQESRQLPPDPRARAPARRGRQAPLRRLARGTRRDRKSTRLNSSHEWISYAVFCLKKKKKKNKSKIRYKKKKNTKI